MSTPQELERAVNRIRELEAALADAWDAGYEGAVSDYGCDIPFPHPSDRGNPHRAQPHCTICGGVASFRTRTGATVHNDCPGPDGAA